MLKATKELNRIAELDAFNVLGYINKRKLNQFATRYTFDDGSKLLINHYTATGFSFKKKLLKKVRELKINARG